MVERAYMGPDVEARSKLPAREAIMRVRVIGRLKADGVCVGLPYPSTLREWATANQKAKNLHSEWYLRPEALPDAHLRQLTEPVCVGCQPLTGDVWLFKNRFVSVDLELWRGAPDPSVVEELLLKIKHTVLKEERRLSKMQREVQALENLERLTPSVRQQIPDAVRLFVWQRDEGKCVSCGRKENIEFDHVIPVVEGGSSTERNVQLLCEGCNRSKGRSV
jgi:hypothetical protein